METVIWSNLASVIFVMVAILMVYKRFAVPKPGLPKPKQETTKEETPVSETTHAHGDDSHGHEDDSHGHGHGELKKKKVEVSNGKAMTVYRSNKELFDIALSVLIVLVAYFRYHWDGVYGDAAYAVLGLGIYYGLSRDSDALKYFAWTAGIVVIVIALFPNVAGRIAAWDPLAPKETVGNTGDASVGIVREFTVTPEVGVRHVEHTYNTQCIDWDDGKEGMCFVVEGSMDKKTWFPEASQEGWDWYSFKPTEKNCSITITLRPKVNGTCKQ